MAKTLLDMDRLPTMEELKEFFKKMTGRRRRLVTRLRERLKNRPKFSTLRN